VNWTNFLLKAAWWMCMEITKMKENPMVINRKYFYVYFENFPALKKIKLSWINHIPKFYFEKINIDTKDYWNKRYSYFFKKNSIFKFEQLNIWHNSILKELFVKNTGRIPRLSFLNRFNLFLYFFLEYLRLIKKFFTFARVA
jgi:hypothetical protein